MITLFQITQQLEGICLQVIGTVLQQHVLGKQHTGLSCGITFYLNVLIPCLPLT